MSVLSSISALKNKVNLYIKQNFQQLITGPVLNTILHDTIDTIQSLISPLESNKLNKTAVGYDPIGGLNIPSGTYRVNGVDILTLIVSGGGGPAGDHNASAGALPTVGTGIAGAIKKGDYWRVSVAGTITGMTPNAVLQLGDVIFARIAAATVAADFFAISGNADISAILFAITTINAKLSTIETGATADQTASEIRDLLVTLLTTDRLPQSAVRDIVNAEYINASFTSLDTIKKALDACVTKLDTAVLTAQINALKDSVPAGGDTLRKLYEAIQTINTLLTSNDVNLDTIQEIITFIKNNKDVIDSVSTSKVNISDIVDTLLSVAPNRPLSANQGSVLKGLIDSLSNALTNKVDKITGKGLSTEDYSTLEKAKLAAITGTNTGDQNLSALAPLRPAITKTALVDADETTGNDSATTFGQIKTTWLNVKAFLKTYFDTLYQAVLVSGTNLKTVGGTSLLGAGDIPISAAITIDPVPTSGSPNAVSSGGTASAIIMATTGLLNQRPNFDASVNTYPTTNGSGTAGAIKKGDYYVVSVQGTINGNLVTINSSISAQVDAPGQVPANWDILNAGLGFMPENKANKVTAFKVVPTDTNYPSEKLTFDAAFRYTFSDKTADYTLALADIGVKTRMNCTIANKVTLPLNSVVPIPNGYMFIVRSIGIGVTSIFAAPGVTINSPNGSLSLSAQYNEAICTKEGTDLWGVVLQGANLLPNVASGEKVVTIIPAGVQITYDIISAPVSPSPIAAADFTSGTATITGTQGQWAYDINYYYFCVGTNSWIRLANTSSIYPLYLSRYNDSGGIPTTVALNTTYPSAQIGQITWGTTQGLMYEKMDATTWIKKTAITI